MSHHMFNQWATTSSANEPPHLQPVSHHIYSQWATTSSTSEPPHLQPVGHHIFNMWATTCSTSEPPQWSITSSANEPPNLQPVSHHMRAPKSKMYWIIRNCLNFGPVLFCKPDLFDVVGKVFRCQFISATKFHENLVFCCKELNLWRRRD